MPVSIVVGGQYGSEGKGKVALAMVRRDPSIAAVIRPGGTNSGHTGYNRSGERIILRQFPAAAIDGRVSVIFPAGSYINVSLFFTELDLLGLDRSAVIIDRNAHVISDEHQAFEKTAGLIEGIGSTGSGTGASVLSRIWRYGTGFPRGIPVDDVPELSAFVKDVPPILAEFLRRGDRIVIEGTQGFGLSPLHGQCWPKATSRDTIAASFLSEAGLPPRTVDEVVLVLRTYPIRVAGDSGRLMHETSWEDVTRASGSAAPLREYTSVTRKLRRIGRFDPTIVRRAILANGPTKIVLNHLDYIDASIFESSRISPAAREFVSYASEAIGHRITDVGTGPTCLFELNAQAPA